MRTKDSPVQRKKSSNLTRQVKELYSRFKGRFIVEVLTNRMKWPVMASVLCGCSLVVMFRHLPCVWTLNIRPDFDLTGIGLNCYRADWNGATFCVQERLALLRISLGLVPIRF